MPSDYPYEERCYRAIRELKDASHIHLNYDSIAPVSPESGDVELVLRKLSEEYGVQLDDTFRQYFFSPNEIHVHWRTMEAPDVVGEFCLHHLQEGIRDPEYVPDDTTLELEEQEILMDLRAIDSAPHGGAGQVATVRIKGAPRFEIWYYDMSHRRLELLDIDYAGYMDSVLATKGTSGWQYLFADVDLRSTEMHGVRVRLEAMLNTFPQWFPGYDYTLLRERLEARL